MATAIADDNEEYNEEEQAEAFRKAVARRVLLETDHLVDELFAIAYDEEADARSKLSAISMLLDRALPKMGVQHTRQEEVEEQGSKKQIREEIERLLLGDEEEDV